MNEISSRDVPSDPYQALLQAAFGESAQAVQGWRAWRQTVDLDNLPPDMFELMPALYANIHPLVTTDSRLGRLKGIYRQTWLRNQRLWRLLEPIWRACEKAGVSVAFLDNLSLTWETGQLNGLAQISPAALLTKAGETRQIISVLQSQGWRAAVELPANGTENWLTVRQSQSFHHSGVGALQVFWSLRWPGQDEEFLWTDASLPRLNPTVEMLLACLPQRNPFRQAATVLHLLRRGQPDWGCLLQWTEKWLLGCSVHKAFGQVRDVHGDSIPDAVWASCRTLADHPEHRRVYRLQTRSSEPWSHVRWLWELYMRSPLCAPTQPNRLLGFCHFLKNRGTAGRLKRRLFHTRSARRNA